MDTNYLENNYLTLVGKVTGEKKFSHEIYGERFYVFNLEIERLSGNADIIAITVSERLVTDVMANAIIEGKQGESFETEEVVEEVSEEPASMEEVVAENEEK